jgi:plastocyanin
MRFRSPLSWTLVLTLLALGCGSQRGLPDRPPEAHEAAAALRGRLAPRPASRDAGNPILVYLEPVPAPAVQSRVARAKTVALRRREGALQPSFVLAHPGQVLIFSNQDEVHHSIFSYSEPNAFELGTLGVGEIKPISFSAPGAVRFYCSLHEAEHGLIFVTPSPHLALADERGEYSLVGVPPGRYRLRTWSGAHTAFDQEVTLRAGESAWREIDIEVAAEPGGG